MEAAYGYEGDGNISSLETKAGEKVLLSFAYRYDGNGNRTVKTGTQAGLGGIVSEITEGNNALDISYSYDIRGQLLEERRNGVSVSYAYDKAGNRIRKTDAKGATLYRFNGKNQLIETENSESKNQFTYDRQGGIVKEKDAAGIRLFSYNSRHQQTKVETENGSVQENRYDVESLRFELLENGRRTSFVYHNGELLHEEGGEGNRTSYHLGAGIDALQRGQDLSYYHRNEQISTAFITNTEGEIQNSYLYDAFGATLEANEQFQNRIRYTGQQYDDLTGQYYLRARYYNPVLGRFMQEDVYQGDGLNLYAYCGNNPVVYSDQSGYAKTPQQSGDGCPPNGNIGGDENNLDNDDKLSDRYVDSEGNQYDKVSDYLPGDVQTVDGDPLMYSKNNEAGGTIVLSTDAIDGESFQNTIDYYNQEGRKINILSGSHGTPDGQSALGSRRLWNRSDNDSSLASRLFYKEDVATASNYDNVKVYDISKMSERKLSNLLNSTDVNICAWCFSERSIDIINIFK